MIAVEIAGNIYDAARDVKVNLRMDGSDCSFEITLDASADAVLFGRPSPVQIHATFDDELLTIFDGFLADVRTENALATVQCVDGKKFLEGSMLESDYSATDTKENIASDLLAAAEAGGYYAPDLDCAVPGSATVSYSAGTSLKSVFDELFKDVEWRVKDGVLEVRDEVGADRTESVLIASDLPIAETDMLAISNVILGVSDAGNHKESDADSILAYGYARGTIERVEGLSGGSFTSHVQGVLEQKKAARTVWTVQKTLSGLIYLEPGDAVTVEIPSTPLNEAPSQLRVAEVAYDFTAGGETVNLSTDAKKSPVVIQRLRTLEQQVRALQL